MKLNFVKSLDLEKFLKEANRNLKLLPYQLAEFDRTLSKQEYEAVYLKQGKKILSGVLFVYRTKETAHILIIFANKLFRRKGYGEKLLDYAINKMNHKNIHSISINTDNENNPMISLLLKKNFKIKGCLMDKKFIMMIKTMKKDDKKLNLILELLFSPYIFKRASILRNLLKNNFDLLEELDSIQFDVELYKKMNLLTGLLYLRYLTDSNKKELSINALNELGKNIENIEKVSDFAEKIKLLKYLAVHSKKEISQKAIQILCKNLKKISEIENDELKAGTLRYLAVHTTGNVKQLIMEMINKLSNQEVKETSLDYLSTR